VPTLSYKYRIEPNKAQDAALADMLRDFCGLYNAALEERINAFRPVANSRSEIVWGEWTDRKGKKHEGYIRRHLAKIPADNTRAVGYRSQATFLMRIRSECPELARWSFSAEQQVLRRLEKTFKAFFSRGRGFPRFRASARYHASEMRVGDGLTIRKNGRIGFVGVPGDIKVRWHRHLPSKPTSAILTRQAGKWYVVFHVEVDVAQREDLDTVGIDVGLTELVALSDESTLPRPNFTKRGEKRLRRLQRALSRSKKGSKRRRKRATYLAKEHKHIANWRRDHAHNVSRRIVNRYGRIGVENLNIRGLAAGMLAKHMNDAAWRQLVSMIDYKVANTGGQIVYVDPRGTSQECPECEQVGAIPKKLKDRLHVCSCGLVMHRDIASAKVVHYRAFGFKARNGQPKLFEAVAA
jgi:putative transposase